MITITFMRGIAELVQIEPDENSTQSKEIMGDNKITLSFTLSRNIDFKIGDWCSVYGEKYILNDVPPVEKRSSREYEYNLTLYAEYYDLNKAQFMFYDATNQLKEGVFSLMANAKTFIDLVIQNANRIGAGWTKGAVVETQYVNMSFSSESCLAVLGRLAEQFGTEYYIDGKKISLDARFKDTGITLSNGKRKGLYTIGRKPLNDSKVVTRLYAFGSDKNLPPDYRNYSTRLKMTGGALYLEKNVSEYGIVEYTQVFDSIYPHRTGKVTNVNFADPFIFVDNTMDFDLNAQLLPNIAAKVTFNTGQLAGYTFDINRYDAGLKQFRILKNKNEKAIDVPSTSFRPAIGDEYVLVDIQMPPSYVTAAEAELTAEAQKLLDKLSSPQFEYPLTVDPAELRRRNVKIQLGDQIWIVEPDWSLNQKIRTIGYTRTFKDEFDYQLTLADGLKVNVGSELYRIGENNGRSINDLTGQVNGRASENDFVGSVTMADLPTTNDVTEMFPVYADATGKLYVKI